MSGSVGVVGDYDSSLPSVTGSLFGDKNGYFQN